MLNKRLKDELKTIKNREVKIKMGLGTLALMTMCIALLIISTFTQIKFSGVDTGVNTYLQFEYIPQIPIVLFIATLLGESFGLLTILIYIILGLTPNYPIFGMGGGLSYIFQYNFGYIFAYIFAVIFTAKELKKDNTIISILKAVLFGVLIIHIIGIFYMTINALIRHDSFAFIGNWIYYQSISKILFDIVFGIIAILIGKIIKKFLWLILN